MRIKSFLPLLCVAMLFPSIATAQFFEPSKVVVWDVYDNNSNVVVERATKYEIYSSMISALAQSDNYVAFECNSHAIEQHVVSQGLTLTPSNIAAAVRAKYGSDYIIFTTVKVLDSSNAYAKILIVSEFFSTRTLQVVRAAYVEAENDVRAISTACAKLVGDLVR